MREFRPNNVLGTGRNMFPTIARLLLLRGKRVVESNKRNGWEHVPTCSQWPPAWLRSAPADSIPISIVPVDCDAPPPETSTAPAELPARLPFGFPADAVTVIADADGYTDRAMKGEAYMWTWIN